MPEAPRYHHISSAVVSVLPAMADDVVAQLSAMRDVEVHAHEGGKIVVVIEGASTGVMGDRLTRIALLDGVDRRKHGVRTYRDRGGQRTMTTELTRRDILKAHAAGIAAATAGIALACIRPARSRAA